MTPRRYFTPATFAFLRDLADNNDRDWFKANQDRYESTIREPAIAFIEDFAAPLGKISEYFSADPRKVGGSLFRIQRDTRFSKDKTPYKLNTGVQFRHITGKDAHAPGFYLHLEPGEVMCGIGIWMPDNPTLTKIRDAIVADPAAWTKLKQDLADGGFEWMTRDALKRPPRGYDQDHEHVEDLKLKSFAVGRTFGEEAVTRAGFIDTYAEVCRAAAPLNAFICKAIGLPY